MDSECEKGTGILSGVTWGDLVRKNVSCLWRLKRASYPGTQDLDQKPHGTECSNTPSKPVTGSLQSPCEESLDNLDFGLC